MCKLQNLSETHGCSNLKKHNAFHDFDLLFGNSITDRGFRHCARATVPQFIDLSSPTLNPFHTFDFQMFKNTMRFPTFKPLSFYSVFAPGHLAEGQIDQQS